MIKNFARRIFIAAMATLPMASPALAVSAAGSIITSTSQSIVDSGNNTWTLVSSPSNGLLVYENGKQTISANVIQLAYIGGKVYQENKSLGWWSWNGADWVGVTNPLASSPSGTAVPPAAQIIDGSSNSWTISGGIVEMNGQPAGYSAGVIELYYVNGIVYQENSAQGWWSWTGTTWADASKPTGGVTSGTTGVATGAGGSSPSGISVDLSSPTGNKVPGTLWGVSTGALIDNSFAGNGGGTDPAFQAAAKSLNLQSMRFNIASNQGIWEESIFANGVNNPNWSYLDEWFAIAPTFWNSSNRLIVGVGPGYSTTTRTPAEWASIAVQLATHFKAKGMEVFYWEVGNEPDGAGISVSTYIPIFNAIAVALHQYNPSYKVGGPVISWDNGAYITPWAQQCGSNADFTDWHNYPVSLSTSDAAMYQTGISGEANALAGQLAGTAMAGKPYALLEYNINYNPGAEPRQITYKNAVYTALRLTESYKQTPLFEMGGIWDIMKDSNYGIIGPNSNANSVIVPVGYYLGEAGQAMPGVQVPATVSVSGNLKAFATMNGNNFAIQIVNYDTAATYNIGITAKASGGGNFGGTYNVWEIGSANPTLPKTGQMAYNATLSIPPATVVILTAAQ